MKISNKLNAKFEQFCDDKKASSQRYVKVIFNIDNPNNHIRFRKRRNSIDIEDNFFIDYINMKLVKIKNKPNYKTGQLKIQGAAHSTMVNRLEVLAIFDKRNLEQRLFIQKHLDNL